MTHIPLTYIPWPYAAKAVIHHWQAANELQLRLTFHLPMDEAAKPPDNLWPVLIDAVPRAVNASAWIDQFTLGLQVINVPAPPAEVLLVYLGPHPDLRTTWGKQWEPWGPILSGDVG